MQEGTHRIKGSTEEVSDRPQSAFNEEFHRLKSDSPFLICHDSFSMQEETNRIRGSTEESDPHHDLPSMPEEELEKVATRVLKKMKSSFVTLEDFQSVVLQMELKMEGFFREIISKGKDLSNTIVEEGRSPMLDPSSSRTSNELMQLANSGSATDMVIDATSMESVGDTPIYVCAAYRPICGGNVKTKWYMMGDGLENGVEFLFDSPPPHSVGDSASVIVGSELFTMVGIDLDKFFKNRPHRGIFPTLMSNKLYVKDLPYPDSDWKEGPSMSEIRTKPYAAVVNRKLYVFGSDCRPSWE